MTKFPINRRFFILAATSFAVATVISSCGTSQNSTSTAPTSGQKEKIKVGVTPVPAGDILKFVKDNLAPQAGLDIEIITFNDFVQNNTAGEVYGVLGQSGAGKSTLIRCVNQLEKPTSGSVIVNGQEMTTLSGVALRQARQHIGMIFQHFNLLSSRTVAQNVAFPLEVMGYSKIKRRQKVEELLPINPTHKLIIH